MGDALAVPRFLEQVLTGAVAEHKPSAITRAAVRICEALHLEWRVYGLALAELRDYAFRCRLGSDTAFFPGVRGFASILSMTVKAAARRLGVLARCGLICRTAHHPRRGRPLGIALADEYVITQAGWNLLEGKKLQPAAAELVRTNAPRHGGARFAPLAPGERERMRAELDAALAVDGSARTLTRQDAAELAKVSGPLAHAPSRPLAFDVEKLKQELGDNHGAAGAAPAHAPPLAGASVNYWVRKDISRPVHVHVQNAQAALQSTNAERAQQSKAAERTSIVTHFIAKGADLFRREMAAAYAAGGDVDAFFAPKQPD